MVDDGAMRSAPVAAVGLRRPTHRHHQRADNFAIGCDARTARAAASKPRGLRLPANGRQVPS